MNTCKCCGIGFVPPVAILHVQDTPFMKESLEELQNNIRLFPNRLVQSTLFQRRLNYLANKPSSNDTTCSHENSKKEVVSSSPSEIPHDDDDDFKPTTLELPKRVNSLQELENGGGLLIKKLKLTSQVVFQNLESLKDILYCKFTPRLRVLDLEVNYDFDIPAEISHIGMPKMNKSLKVLRLSFPSEKTQNLPVEWFELFQHYPRLEALEISHGKKGWTKELEKILLAMVEVRKRNKKIFNLKKLDIGQICGEDNYTFALTPAILKHFQDAKLPLEELVIDFGRTFLGSVVQDIFKAHKLTMKILKVSLGQNETFFLADALPYLKLMTLEVTVNAPIVELAEKCFRAYVKNIKIIIKPPVAQIPAFFTADLFDSDSDSEYGPFLWENVKDFI